MKFRLDIKDGFATIGQDTAHLAPMRTPASRHQSGFSLLEVLLAVGVAIALGSMQLNQIRAETESAQAEAAGRQLEVAGRALNTYIGLAHPHLVSGTSVAGAGTVADPGPRTCTAIATSQGPGWQCTITTETLQRTGLLPAAFSGVNSFGSNYDFVIRVQGTAPDWRVDGLVRTTRPYMAGGQVREDLIGQALARAGSDAGAVVNTGGTINGLSGIWTDDTWGFGTPVVGMLGYRVGYGATGFNALLRTDGSNSFTDDLNMDGHSVTNIDRVQVANDLGGGRLVTQALRNDAIVLGTNNPATQTVLGNNGNSLRIQTQGGVQFVDGAGNGTPLSAGNINVGSVTARGTAIFGGAVTARGLATSGGQNMASTGAITADGDFVTTVTTTDGGFHTVAGSFNTTNGNLSTKNGTVLARDLNIGGSASVGGTVRFGTAGAGWFYDQGSNTMTLGNNSNLLVGGTGCDLTGSTPTTADDCRAHASSVVSEGLLTTGRLRIAAPQAPGAPCLSSTFSTDSAGRMMECVGGTYRIMGGARTVTVLNSSIASAGQQVSVACPTGYRMVGGGWRGTRGAATDPYAPSKSFGNAGTNSWTIENIGTGHTATFQAQVVCAQS